MEDKKSKIKKVLNNYLTKLDKGELKSFNLDSFRGLTNKELIEIIVDHALEYNVPETTINYYFNIKNLVELLKYDDTKEKVINLLKKYRDNIVLSYEISEIIINSNFNLYFLIGLESFYDFTDFPNRELSTIFRHINEKKLWDDSNVKKFFIYFFNNPAYVIEFSYEISIYFQVMSETLKRFLVAKTDLLETVGIRTWVDFLNDGRTSETVGELIMKKINWGDEDVDDIVKFYLRIDEKYRKFLFANDQDFYIWLGDKENHDDVLSVLDDLLSSERVNQFFRWNPNWVEHIDHEEGKVKLKYGISGVPDFVKDSIKLDMVEQAKFDGDDIEKMFYDHRDSPSVWVKYYVDDELWDHTINWDYSPDESTIRNYYWDDINEKNLNTIKEILKKENPEINLDDEDEVKDAAFENDEISSVLHIGASDGEREGDVTKLIEDIESGFNELFGKDNWKKVDNKVYATIDLNHYDNGQIYDAYNDCGEWYIKCIFTTIRSDYMENRDKPSLPEYRYGIQGDFDKDVFNDYIAVHL